MAVTTWRSLGDRDSVPPSVGDRLDRLTRALGVPAAGTLATVFNRWEQIVGPEVALHSKPVSLRDGRLVIAVDEPAWASHLGYLKAEMLSNVAAAVGASEVTSLVIRTGRKDRG